MSARHRAFLAAKQNAQKVDENALSEEESEGEEIIGGYKVPFTALDSSDDDEAAEGESCDDHGDEIIPPIEKLDNISFSDNIPTPADPHLDDMVYLDSVIHSHSLNSDDNDLDSECPKDGFLAVNSKLLDVDDVMKRRFGGRNVGTHDDTVQQGRKKHGQRARGNRPKVSSVHSKRHVFGAPKEDWPRPVTFVCGGISMRETAPPSTRSAPSGEVWFKYHWSDDYSRLQDSFEIIQNTGDVNMLALFIARNPHHQEALVQLGMLFARTGHMDRAADLIRRSIYYIESSHIDTFRPYVPLSSEMDSCEKKKAMTRMRCRLDCDLKENRIFFLALFRHMQMVGMLGCPSVAADVGRCLLAVCPDRDPMSTLLYIDHFLVVSGRSEEVFAFCSADAAEALSLPHWPCASGCSSQALLHDILPNWAFSLSLSQFVQEGSSLADDVWRAGGRKLSGEQVVPRQRESVALLLTSLRRFPFMLFFIVSSSSDVPEGASCRSGNISDAGPGISSWRQILDHSFFQHFSRLSRLEGVLEDKNVGLLAHLAEVFHIRSVGDGGGGGTGNSSWLWRSDDVLAWLFYTCKSLLSSLDSPGETQKAITFAENYLRDITHLVQESTAGGLWLQRYSSCQLEDFLPEYPRLPPEANPLDPQLADPRVLSGEVNLPPQALDALRGLLNPRGRRGGRAEIRGLEDAWTRGGAIERAVYGGEVNDAAVRAELQLLRDRGVTDIDDDEFISQLHALGRHEGRSHGNLDPNMPLLQLFFATLLPWNELNTSMR